jgi:hypothetical protein
MKTKVLIAGGVVAVLAVSVFALSPRHYYRYDGLSVSIVSTPNACWNGLSRGPCLEFKIPIFRDARMWKPNAEQIRRALKDSKLSYGDLAKVIEACVSYGEQYK